jgi:hypothetical protein
MIKSYQARRFRSLSFPTSTSLLRTLWLNEVQEPVNCFIV